MKNDKFAQEQAMADLILVAVRAQKYITELSKEGEILTPTLRLDLERAIRVAKEQLTAALSEKSKDHISP